jgi:U3 small nucleolar RNA-associated protein 10
MNLLLFYLDLLTVKELLTSCFLSIVITIVMLDLYDKAGALMIVGVLGIRATLAPKLVQNLIFFVARTAQHDASESVDLPWLRVSVMALISLVQVWIQLLVIHILRKFWLA